MVGASVDGRTIGVEGAADMVMEEEEVGEQVCRLTSSLIASQERLNSAVIAPY
jgi:hypothetical protein